MTTARLFDRRCVVLVGEEPEPGDRFLRSPDALRIEGLATAFRVSKDLQPTPNQVEITITNLSRESRAKVEGVGRRVVLLAGYQDTESQQLFSGDMRRAISMKQGVDWVTKIEAGDGERSIAHARVSDSYKPGTKKSDVIKRLVQALQQDPGSALEKAEQVVGEYLSGYAHFGPASSELTRSLPEGWTWSFQDGRLEMLGPEETLAEPELKLSPDSGLIGTPTLNSPAKLKGKAQMRCRCLLTPRARPGLRVTLDSQTLRGTYKVLKVTHSGSTHAGDWYTDIEGIHL